MFLKSTRFFSRKTYGDVRLGRETTSPGKNTLWQPIWLWKTTLIAFAVLFLLLCLALVLVWYLCQRENGLTLTLTTNHYAWTYGPTAILVVVVSLWRQVDYCCKINQPWQEMHRCPQPADQTVLLDYMWPLQITSFITAVQNRHFAVASSTFVFALLKVVTTISTALFVLTPISLDRSVDVKLLDKFDTTAFWASQPPFITSNDTGMGWQLGTALFGYATFGNMPQDPVWNYLNLCKDYGANASPIELSTAFTNFSVASNTTGGDSKAFVEVDLFVPEVTCQTVPTEWHQQYPANYSPVTYLQINVPTCAPLNLSVYPCGSTTDVNKICSTSKTISIIERADCSGDLYDPINYHNISYLVNSSTPNIYQYIVVAADLEIQNISQSFNVTRYEHILVNQAAAASCKLSYSIQKGMATTSVSDPGIIESMDVVTHYGSPHISNLTDLLFAEAVLSSLQSGHTVFDNTQSPLDETLGAYALFNLMASTTQGDLPFDTFLDAETLSSAARDVFIGLSHQVMMDNFLTSRNSSSQGTVQFVQQRLQVRPAALWTMVACFALMSCLTVVVTCCTHTAMAPNRPVLLLSQALCLSKSPSLANMLQGSGAKPLNNIQDDLAASLFSVGIRGEMIEISHREDNDTPLNKPRKWYTIWWRWFAVHMKIFWKQIARFFNWCTRIMCCCFLKKAGKAEDQKPKSKWMPYSARRHAILLTMALPLVVVAVLEVLWHFSRTDESFVRVSGDSSAASYAIRYGSTVTVLIIATLFNTLDFAIATMTPFRVLSRGRASAQRTISFAIVGDLPPIALYKAIRGAHIGATSSALASLIGSVLTIIASGLWYMNDSVLIKREATGVLGTTWNINWTSGLDADNGATSLFSAIQHGRIDDSHLIWQNVVLSELQDVAITSTTVSEFSSMVNRSSLQYDFTVSALRPQLLCEVLPQSALQVNRNRPEGGSLGSGPPKIDGFLATVDLPAGCFVDGNLRNDSITFYYQAPMFYGDETVGVQWLGSLNDLNVTASAVASNGCPSLGVIFGRYVEDPTQNRDITILACSQRLEEVQTMVTYSGSTDIPIAEVSGSARTIESTKKNLADADTGITSLSNRVATHFKADVNAFPTSEQYDSFFSQLIAGPNGTAQEAMLGIANSNVLVSAMNTLYQRYMTHVIDLNFRSNGSQNGKVDADPLLSSTYKHYRSRSVLDPASSVISGVARAFASRLKLSEASKIALQVMLCVMVLLGSLAYLSTDLRHTLPRNPWPVASAMTFFADSELCQWYDSTRDDGDAAFVKQLKRQMFSLGWWDIRHSQRSRSQLESESESGYSNVHHATGGEPSSGEQEEVASLDQDLAQAPVNTVAETLPMLTYPMSSLKKRELAPTRRQLQHIRRKPLPSTAATIQITSILNDAGLLETESLVRPGQETRSEEQTTMKSENSQERPRFDGSGSTIQQNSTGLVEIAREEAPKQGHSSDPTKTPENKIICATTAAEMSQEFPIVGERFGIDIAVNMPVRLGYSGKHRR